MSDDPIQLKLPFQDKPPKPDLGGLSWEEQIAKSQRFLRRLKQSAEQTQQQRAATSSESSD